MSEATLVVDESVPDLVHRCVCILCIICCIHCVCRRHMLALVFQAWKACKHHVPPIIQLHRFVMAK